MSTGKTIHIRGTVQGVGMRPTVWRLAQQFGLVGEVWNDGLGVTIQAWGTSAALEEFIRQLPLQAPPLAKIGEINCLTLDAAPQVKEFKIIASRSGDARTAIAADAATCPACLAEISDPGNRRYRYPFTNCTHCGPRLSIVTGIPYDRCNTAMAAFPQCPACQAEYDNPADRRFHAQANACPVCGPELWLEDPDGVRIQQAGLDAIALSAELIRQGHILAIKGIGGFHLACDAGNERAVSTLRQRKQRYDKPFALMGRDIAMLSAYVRLSVLEQQLLSGPAAPIVILNKQGAPLAAAVAPGDDKLGCMLPYTPLHHSLLQALDAPMVLTSGNRSEEPQCITNEDARLRLTGIADYWLLHNRKIAHRLDDSVLRVMDGQPRLLRRARGFTPQTLTLPSGFERLPPVLAMGGELKNTFCILKDGQAILSPHIGDLENAEVQIDYRHLLDAYRQLFDFKPELIAVDLHPNYLSTQYGLKWATQNGLKMINVQHHHAHIAACMAEYGLALDSRPALGIAMDGLGLGAAGQLWGGEFFKADYRRYERLATFQPLPLLGGVQAMRQPWRNTYAHLKHYFDWRNLSTEYAELDIIRFLNAQPLAVFDKMLAKQINSPLSSSCGRCFDAFAAALGICREAISYEGQAAIGLENLAAPVFEKQRGQGYRHASETADGLMLLSWRPFWLGLFHDLRQRQELSVIAARIHHGFAQAIVETTLVLSERIGSDTVILTGGVFQNRLLLEEVSRLLRLAGKTVYSPSKLPASDGGLAFGQAIIAAAHT